MSTENAIPFHTKEPYCATPEDLVIEKLKLLELKEGDVVMDLGSGNARALILACQMANVRCIGYEILPEALADAEKNIQKANLSSRIEIRNENFEYADLSEANALILYLSRSVLGELSLKLENELKKGVKIVTDTFDIPAWEIKKEFTFNTASEGPKEIYLFEKE